MLGSSQFTEEEKPTMLGNRESNAAAVTENIFIWLQKPCAAIKQLAKQREPVGSNGQELPSPAGELEGIPAAGTQLLRRAN